MTTKLRILNAGCWILGWICTIYFLGTILILIFIAAALLFPLAAISLIFRDEIMAIKLSSISKPGRI